MVEQDDDRWLAVPWAEDVRQWASQDAQDGSGDSEGTVTAGSSSPGEDLHWPADEGFPRYDPSNGRQKILSYGEHTLVMALRAIYEDIEGHEEAERGPGRR